MTGAFLGLAAAHVPAVADGLISVVAALCAVRLCPAARDAIFLSHASKEPGYRRAAEELGLRPSCSSACGWARGAAVRWPFRC